MSSSTTEPALIASLSHTICIDSEDYPVVEIRATGDILLDVSFENTNSCNKSIPTDALRIIRAAKSPIPSPRIFYRVRLETLKKQSRYFANLLGPNFAEGANVTETFGRLAKLGLNPTEVAADELPRIRITDDDAATKTLGRESVFRDMLRIIHGAVCQSTAFLLSWSNNWPGTSHETDHNEYTGGLDDNGRSLQHTPCCYSICTKDIF